MSENKVRTAHCLCGGVEMEVRKIASPGVTFCHCEDCRRTTGHFHAAVRVMDADCTMKKEETLAWYKSSDHASRGFCNRCGGNLFWRMNDVDYVGVQVGMFDMPCDIPGWRHIFMAGKGDYYEINDDLPKEDKW